MRPDDPALINYAQELRQELLIEADTEGVEAMLPEVLTRRGIDVLVELGEVEDATDCYHVDRPLGIEVSGYGVDDGDTLNLIATIHRGEVPPSSVTRTQVDTAFDRLLRFWERCRDRPYHEKLEESSDPWDMALQVHRSARGVRRLRLFLITDGVSAVEYVEPETIDGVEVRRSVWDVMRLFRQETAGEHGEPIEVDVQRLAGGPLPCLPAPRAGDYTAYLAMVPGSLLAGIYDEYGARLLERNVRAFLQFTGKVNKGMRDTLASDPDRFLAYNNGISATASRVDLVALEGGGRGIARLHDLQIVNGGQTTASIHRSMRSGVDISDVLVQAKITEVEGEALEEMVPLISRYANSQNKVSEADLRSNDPFHTHLETLSRTVWAPATGSTMRQTRWFYERSRGSYRDAMTRESTPKQRRVFREVNPTSQKFTKTDLAKFENTWRQQPHIVSLGAQKNFTAFMASLDRSFRPDIDYFRRAVAKAILFKNAERIVQRQNFGGYRANIVTYALAKLAYATQQRIDLLDIWEHQAIEQPIADAIEELSYVAHRHLTSADRPTANVTEWAKRQQCWTAMRQLHWDVPRELEPLLVRLGPGAPGSTNGAQRAGSDDPVVRAMAAIPPDHWFAIANWAKQTGNLQPRQRKIAYDIGVRISRQGEPTPRQAAVGKAIVEAAHGLGFRLATD